MIWAEVKEERGLYCFDWGTVQGGGEVSRREEGGGGKRDLVAGSASAGQEEEGQLRKRRKKGKRTNRSFGFSGLYCAPSPCQRRFYA